MGTKALSIRKYGNTPPVRWTSEARRSTHNSNSASSCARYCSVPARAGKGWKIWPDCSGRFVDAVAGFGGATTGTKEEGAKDELTGRMGVISGESKISMGQFR